MINLLLILALLLLIFIYHYLSWQPKDTSVLYKNFPYLLFGHRGSPDKEPENTIPAFKQAIQDKCNAIELDLHCTRDGHLVVFHDETLERTTNGVGRVSDKTLEELQTLNAAQLWPGRNEQIPTLKTVVDAIPEDIILNFEMKSYTVFSGHELAEKIVKFIHKYDLKDRVIVSSFNPFCIWRLRRIDPNVFTALLWYEPSWYSLRHMLGVHIAHPDIIHPSEEDLTPALWFWARRKDLPLHVWVVNDAKRIEELAENPIIKGIMADDTQLLTETLTELVA